jgi:phosphohistidine phosphatase
VQGRTVSSGISQNRPRGNITASKGVQRLSEGPVTELEVGGLINPNDNPAAFDWPSGCRDRDISVVGHLPLMARLVARLVTGDQDRPITAYRPGSVVCLQQDDEGAWAIAWMIRPELLGH